MELEDKLINDLESGNLKKNSIEYKLAKEALKARANKTFDMNTLNLDNKLIRLQNEFKKYRWDNEKRLRRLGRLKGEVNDIYMDYSQLNDQKGMHSSKILKKEIKKALSNGKRYVKNKKERQSRSIKRFFSIALVAVCIAGAGYGIFSLHSRYEDYISKQNKKLTIYQQRFDDVKEFASKGSFKTADDLSEILQNDLKAENFLSPSNALLKEVKKYDDIIIDRELRKRKYYQIVHKLENTYENAGRFLDDIKYWIEDHKKLLSYLGLLVFGLYLLKKL